MKRTLLQIVAALFSGLLLGILWAPFNQTSALWFALVPLLLLIRHTSAKRAALLGFITGLTSWLIQLAWLLILTENEGPWYLVAPGWIGLSAVISSYMAIFAGMAAACRNRLSREPGPARILLALICEPVLWAACETLRATLFTGFAWNPLGLATATTCLPVLQTAALGGAVFVSAIVVGVNGAIATVIERLWWSLRRRNPTTRAQRFLLSCETTLPLVVLAIAFCWGSYRIQRYRQLCRTQNTSATFILEQTQRPCVFQSGEGLVSNIDAESTQEKLSLLSDLHANLPDNFKIDAWVWPESSLDSWIQMDRTAFLKYVDAARKVDTTILPGGSYLPDNSTLYNAIIPITARGIDKNQVYAKRHLVPFGEYIPFDKTFPALQKFVPTGFTCTPGEKVKTIRLASGLVVGPLICFEDTVADLARSSVNDGAQVLINASNDAWYAGSSEIAQHAQQSILRAIETGTPVVRSTNGGFNTTIDAVGYVTAVPENTYPSRVATLSKPFASFYLTWGDLVFGAPCTAFLLILFVAFSFKKISRAHS